MAVVVQEVIKENLFFIPNFVEMDICTPIVPHGGWMSLPVGQTYYPIRTDMGKCKLIKPRLFAWNWYLPEIRIPAGTSHCEFICK